MSDTISNQETAIQDLGVWLAQQAQASWEKWASISEDGYELHLERAAYEDEEYAALQAPILEQMGIVSSVHAAIEAAIAALGYTEYCPVHPHHNMARRGFCLKCALTNNAS